MFNGLRVYERCICTRGDFRTLFCEVSALCVEEVGGKGDNKVPVPSASDNQSIHARTI